MKTGLHHLLNLGINPSYLLSQQRQIRLINIVTLIIVIICIFFSVINIISELWPQLFLALVAILGVCIPTLLLNYKELHNSARDYLVLCLLVIVNMGSYATLFDGRDTDLENLFFALAALTFVLYSGWSKAIFFALCIASMSTVKYFKFTYLGIEINYNFYHTLANLMVTFTAIYFFIASFKRDLFQTQIELQQSHDLLEGQQAEMINQRNALSSNRYLLRSMIDNVPLFLAMLDRKGNYLIVNSRYQEAFGIPVEEIEGQYYQDILPKNILDEHIPLVERSLAGETASFDQTIDLPNGEEFWSFGKYIPIKDKQDNVVFVSVYVSDITQLKRTEERLQLMNNTKDRLFSIISHDLKSPINSLRGLLSLVQHIEKDEFVTYVNKIEPQLNAVSFTLENLLNWAKGQLEGFKVKKRDLDIAKPLNDCLELYNVPLTQKKIAIEYEVEEGQFISIDRDHLNLVLRNILSNAIKFTPPKGVIKIKSTRENGSFVLQITDNGAGMSEELLKELLDGKISDSLNGTEGEKGTGLGLAICREVLNNNDCQLDIKSKLNTGTTVSITIPISQTQNNLQVS